MTTLTDIKNSLPAHAKDIKLNISMVLYEEGAPGLSLPQQWGSALAAALTAGHGELIEAVESAAGEHLSAEEITGVKTAVSMMGMTNIYYRFTHMAGGDYGQMPAKLRMNALAQHGINKVDFELFSLSASMITGCEMCVTSHEKVVRKEGISTEGVQSVARIAAVMHAAAVTLRAENATTKGAAQAA